MRSVVSVRTVLALWACAAAVGCGAILDLGSYSTAGEGGDAAGGDDGGGGGGAGGAGGQGGLGSCGTSSVCAVSPPAGWHGPLALTEDGCGGSYPQAEATGVELLDAPSAVCTCTCGAPAGELCDGPQLSWSATQTCSPPSGNPWSPGCLGAFSPPPNDIVAMRAHPAEPTSGICQPIFTADNPAISSRDVTMCRGAEPGGGCAAGQICLPIPGESFDPRLCIYAEGDAECPSGIGYSDKHTVNASGLTDSRGCTNCECAPSSGAACTGQTEVHSNTGCSLLKATVPHDDSCVTFSPGFGSLKTTVSVVPGSCEASGGLPDGGVVGQEPMTVCCTPPL